MRGLLGDRGGWEMRLTQIMGPLDHTGNMYFMEDGLFYIMLPLGVIVA